MKRITQEFTVHPVGQGLFYSGTITTAINNNKEIFRFVFDCGSLTTQAGQDEVKRYKQEYFSKESDRLNLLVISHFDADHVNQIKNLLATTRKVDKVVMPFVDFEERFFLALRYQEQHKNAIMEDSDLQSIRFILDPIGQLTPHLGDDDATAVFLVTTDPDNPGGNGEIVNESNNDFALQSAGLEFGFKNQERRLTEAEKAGLFQMTLLNDSKVGIVKDSIAGDIHFITEKRLELMEFIFYRRQATQGDEKKFFKYVFASFCKRYNINTNNSTANVIDAIVDALKKVKGATEIRKCYKEASHEISLKYSPRDILNMNTTSLCMLHRNLNSIFKIFNKRPQWPNDHWLPFVLRIEKPFGSHSVTFNREVIVPFRWDFSHVPFAEYRRKLSEESYPNVLLTSDAYLKLPEEANKFMEKYKHYHDKYWLLQIPHHGSKNNTDRYFYSRMPNRISKFINYGIHHKFEKKFSHPNPETIQELIVAGQADQVHAVNEFTGISFYFHLQTE
jgi:hypothetical protein